MGKGNNIIPNGHFHKNWQRFVKTWFNQPFRKYRRQQKRILKAKSIAPRPSGGPLRPVVRCPTFRYHTKVRAGRGFTLIELKSAGISARFARTIGIAVDQRRHNKSMESVQENVQRLLTYKAKMILFPLNGKKLFQEEANEEQQKLAKQLRGKILPIKNPVTKIKARVPTDDEKNFNAVTTLRKARADAKLFGARAKRIKDAAENSGDLIKPVKNTA